MPVTINDDSVQIIISNRLESLICLFVCTMMRTLLWWASSTKQIGVGWGGALCTLIRSLSLKHRGCARLLPCLWIIEAIQLSGTVYACHFKPNTSQETTLPTRPDRPWCREINLSLFLFQIKYLLALKLCVFLRLTMSSSDWLAGYLFWRRHACHGMCRSQSSERSMMFAVIL